MKPLCRILIALLLAAQPALCAAYPGRVASKDTVVYAPEGYKTHMRGDFARIEIADSLLSGIADTLETFRAAEDSVVLSARDTIVAPDSLKYTDPFRYEYYVALIDSLTHCQVRDSLLAAGDTLLAVKIDSVYSADSVARARQAFIDWYNNLSKDERKKYDFQQAEARKMAVKDSLRDIREERKAIKDSILQATPRILSTYALPPDMHYERIVGWTLDRDFEEMRPFVPDTGYNARFHDRRFMQEDVGAVWLGVEGSPARTYNWFSADASGSGCTFFEPYESWTYTPETFVQYNTKSPYTELCYYGTLLSTGSKEQDNVRFLCTQNITPALNFQILYERFGGGGMLINEETKNKTFAAGVNHLGKRYVMNAGFISDKITMGENGGITDNMWIRDTTVEVREIPVENTGATSSTSKKTFYVDHKYSIPFEFIRNLQHRGESASEADTLESRDITTAFIGHSFEFTDYERKYTKTKSSIDSLQQRHLENRLFLRLQPWSPDAILSRVEGGAGLYSDRYLNVTASSSGYVSESSVYAYAGAGGQFRKYIDWGANARFVIGGADAGDFDIKARLGFKFYPFRKARRSPVSLLATFSSALARPDFYQRHMYSNDATFRWDNDFLKISTTKAEGSIQIPWWKFEARAGYALLDNNLYYANPGVISQNTEAMSVISGYLRKEMSVGDWLHLDNRILLQYSSNDAVIPLPTVAANLRWYFQFVVQKYPDGKSNVMVMQIGVDSRATTPWYTPGWVPALGVFHNQDEEKYTCGPVFDIFMNIQWKRACIFVKYQNAGMGWPLERTDYFSAHRHISTASGMPGLKLGITWPFYPDERIKTVSHK